MSFTRLHSALQYHILNSLEWRTLRPLQEAAIGPILDGANVLLIAPTAGGKTEAAFLPILSLIYDDHSDGVRAIYVGPLKALINDQFRRLEDQATGAGHAQARRFASVCDRERQREVVVVTGGDGGGSRPASSPGGGP